VTCSPGEVVLVPFPFVELRVTKLRPAVILSSAEFHVTGTAVAIMVTSTRHDAWPGDTPIKDLATAGLTTPCQMRLKAASIPLAAIVQILGSLSPGDRAALLENLKRYVPLTA